MLLADAGVDYLIFDTTNAQLYDEELTVLLQIGEELQAKGVKVPLFTFFLNYEPEWKAEALYKNWYQPGKHDSMWFRWDGKPLVLPVRVTISCSPNWPVMTNRCFSTSRPPPPSLPPPPRTG